MSVVVWISPSTWPACVDAARCHAPPGAEIVLLHAVEPASHAAPAHPDRTGRGPYDPDSRLDELAAASGEGLLRAAARRLGRPCTARVRVGRVEREVVAAAVGADLLVLARGGDRPHGPDRATRYVLDHAPCPVLPVRTGPGTPEHRPLVPHRGTHPIGWRAATPGAPG
ncbi:universal stress protein [Kitasatospora sp. NPDC048538]|uniref:universal stress protein n=1 Tax=unclassified Kitasatospora TaxID=2633591 RepID=UPI0033FB4132